MKTAADVSEELKEEGQEKKYTRLSQQNELQGRSSSELVRLLKPNVFSKKSIY